MLDETFFLNYIWIAAILSTIFSAFILKVRSRKSVEENPDLQEGYNQIFLGYLILAIPWAVVGIGTVFGGVKDLFSFLKPRDGNPFVIAFHITLFVVWLLNIWWLFFKGGAEILAKYPGAFGQNIQSPTLIKILYGAALAFGAVVIITMWFG